MKKRILTLVMTMILVVTQVAVPMTSFADTGNTNTPSSYGYDETPADSVTVEVTFSNDGIPLMGLDAAETPLAHLEVTVPYFDLGLYDLQQYYRYGTENGQGKYINDKVVERPTALHLYIYMLERYFLGIPEEDCGTGLQKVLNVSENKAISYYDGMHAYYTNEYNSLTLTGSATSMYMFNFWGHDENLMYYRNHRYPLMSPGWGSCADYILLSEGDRIELAMFTDWSFYHTGAFLSFDKDDYTAVPGQPLTVQVRGTATTPENKDKDNDGDGTLTPEDVKDQPETPILPYTENDIEVALYNEDWERSEAKVTNNGDGTYTIQMPRRVGTYYVMATDADAGTDGADKSPGIAKIVAYDEEVAFQLKKEDAKDEIEWYVDLDDYRAAEQAVLNGIIDDAWAKVDAITDKADAGKIDQIVSEAKTKMDKIKTDAELKAEETAAAAAALAKAKADAKAEIASYKNAADYRDAQKAELTAAITAANTAIDAATSEDAVKKAVSDAKTDMDQIKTDAQLKAEEANKPADKEPVVEKQQLKAPSKVSASNVASTGKVKLTWNKVKGADKYVVYRATSKNGAYKKMFTTTGTQYTNTSAKAGTAYYYKVKAVSFDKDVEDSAYSKIVMRTCDLARPVVKASNIAKTGKVILTWTKVTGAEKYKIYRATSKNGKYIYMNTVTGTSYINKTAKAGKTYYYKVKAIDADNSAANSAFSTVDKRTCDAARPEVTVKSTVKKQVKLTWKKVDGAKKYTVYRATSKNGKYSKVATTTKLSYTNKSLKSGKTYYYKVKAIAKSSAANSAFSTVDKCKVK